MPRVVCLPRVDISISIRSSKGLFTREMWYGCDIEVVIFRTMPIICSLSGVDVLIGSVISSISNGIVVGVMLFEVLGDGMVGVAMVGVAAGEVLHSVLPKESV